MARPEFISEKIHTGLLVNYDFKNIHLFFY